MNTITHALLPVIGSGIDKQRNQKNAEYWNMYRVFTVAAFGAMPDLLNPHISLASRYSSWSHGIAFYLLIIVLIFVLASRKIFKLDYRLASWMAGVYLLHLTCDVFSGGIAWLYPLSNQIIGFRWIHAIWWIPIDIASGFIVYIIFVTFPDLKNLRVRRKNLDKKVAEETLDLESN